MLKFIWPWMSLLLPLPWILHYALKNKARSAVVPELRFPAIARIQTAYARQSMGQIRVDWRVWLLFLAWGCIVVALMRPELVKDVTYSATSGYDLMLAVDLSRSMEIADFSSTNPPTSRISATKKVVANFVEQRVGDRIGLIVFAEQAFLTIPLTMDTKAVSDLLNNLMIGMAGERTVIGDAIGIGVRNLRNRPAESRVLILLTDGADTASHVPPLEAAKIAASSGIKIYTIGMGDKLDEDLLRKISELTSGIYFKVTNVNELAKVYSEIDTLEKSEAQQNVVLIRKPLFQIPTVIALLLMLTAFVMHSRNYGYKYAAV